METEDKKDKNEEAEGKEAANKKIQDSGSEEKIKMRLGCRKAPADPRDLIFKMPKRLQLPEQARDSLGLPPYVNREAEMLDRIEDQGDEPTCVGFAASTMKEWQENKEQNRRDLDLSAQFVYAEARKLNPHPSGGTDLRSAMKVLRKKGICEEPSWPYMGQKQGDVYDEADNYRIAGYVRLPDDSPTFQDSVILKKYALSNCGPFVVGVSTYSNWVGAFATGMITMPGNRDRELGGHAICVIGYDDTGEEFGSDKAGMFKFKNSWGTGWGEQGYGYIPYDYMERYSWDAWASTDVGVPDALLDLDRIIKEAMEENLEMLKPRAVYDSVTEVIIRVGAAQELQILFGED